MAVFFRSSATRRGAPTARPCSGSSSVAFGPRRLGERLERSSSRGQVQGGRGSRRPRATPRRAEGGRDQGRWRTSCSEDRATRGKSTNRSSRGVFCRCTALTHSPLGPKDPPCSSPRSPTASRSTKFRPVTASRTSAPRCRSAAKCGSSTRSPPPGSRASRSPASSRRSGSRSSPTPTSWPARSRSTTATPASPTAPCAPTRAASSAPSRPRSKRSPSS